MTPAPSFTAGRVVAFLAVLLLCLGTAPPLIHLGATAILSDRRIQAAGRSAEAQVTRLAPRSRRGLPGFRTARMSILLFEDPSRNHDLTIGMDTYHRLRRQEGQPITVLIDPADPNRHQFDRAPQMREAWFRLTLGLGLGAAGLWMLVVGRRLGLFRHD